MTTVLSCDPWTADLWITFHMTRIGTKVHNCTFLLNTKDLKDNTGTEVAIERHS